ncbi:hypothetical protein L1987_77533 [Smallanthus sonchifolius]|uniref:Uncharacterized protein n=1 Tax=Smallanthus sonchifolius TaxID=185202 RepID=A0ACB8ZA06_9ASTR|nr:hypothetical protein L1987_77533 [Smallanthus sonchifolius]
MILSYANLFAGLWWVGGWVVVDTGSTKFLRSSARSSVVKFLFHRSFQRILIQIVVKFVVMASDPKAIAVVIMGVSGSGKSTIGEMLGKALNCSFIDADDFHPQSNKEKMKKGIPLSDEDRIPWLEVLRDVLNANLVSGKTVILGCSALQKQYRDILRSADPHDPCAVKFVLLDVGVNLLMDRVQKRAAEGKHFMPVELLQSQIDLLQVDESEGIFKVDASLIPEAIVDDIKRSLF